MANYENDQSPSESSLSPEVVQRFSNACANIFAYGEFVRTKQIVLNELDVEDESLKILTADQTTATHQASGKMHTSPFQQNIYQVELWVPAESVTPRSVVILGQKVTLKTVLRDELLGDTLPHIGNEGRSVITTAENRMFTIESSKMFQQINYVREYTSDTQVELENDILAAFAHDLAEGYPDVRK
jgi:hypothetical protein